MDELKRCPFCGGEAYLFASDGIRVICGTCDASTKVLVDGWYGKKPTGNATGAVIKAWNHRVN